MIIELTEKEIQMIHWAIVIATLEIDKDKQKEKEEMEKLREKIIKERNKKWKYDH